MVVSKKKIPSMGEVWVFSGTTQLNLVLFLGYVGSGTTEPGGWGGFSPPLLRRMTFFVFVFVFYPG